MPRSLLAALVAAVLVVPLLAHGSAVRAAEPAPPEPFVEAAGDAGLGCEAYDSGSGGSGYLCASFEESSERYVGATIAPFDRGTTLTVTRNAFSGGHQVAEPDVYALMVEYVRLALADDAEARGLAWLAEMNARPEMSGELTVGDWRLEWLSEEWDVTEGLTTSVHLGLSQFVSESPTTSPGGADGALISHAESYGLACSSTDVGTQCRRQELEGATGIVYSMTLEHDDEGELRWISANVSSSEPELPPDAMAFLRGVVEESPVSDTAGLLAWLDDMPGNSQAERFRSGEWSADWFEQSDAAGLAWSLSLVREAQGPSAPASPDAVPAVPSPSASPGPDAEPLIPSGPGPRRSFAESVPALTEVSTEPIVLLQSALLAALLVFLMPFPSQLFNSTLETHEDEVRRWFRLDRVGRLGSGIGAFWASWPGVGVFTLLAALLYGFLDPGFGISLGSLATFVGMLLGIALVTAAFAVPAVLAHRRIASGWTLKVVPASLLIGVACVLLSRLTDFQPGYLYGLLIGLAFARELSAADEGRATALGAAAMLAVAFVSWLALGALPESEAFGLVVARTALAALMVAGLEGVVFGLLPMRFLPGESLYAWNRIAWGALLAIGAFAFFHILINPASGYLSDTSRTPLLTVLGLLIGFSLVSVAFWAWFRYRDEPAEAEPQGT
ncbi:MAG: hypothetical protein K5924_02325 [Chloroflexi bacterium]|nr:hypothetical protein [Chloroflexota bacterium]